ncbi:hypothetical protein BVRB_4g095710 [Beta vulgaris subsp. vulgaris]|uniref:Uncharacterized protein n=1 Tax=Beta vulgaris subsp. vulgaris TaxID=3555 RepID=A0A0J8E4R1_BETVV|nr:hypothetical protein BVRB_4g095710 [Beta vulgaris subsp. vulgaris]
MHLIVLICKALIQVWVDCCTAMRTNVRKRQEIDKAENLHVTASPPLKIAAE